MSKEEVLLKFKEMLEKKKKNKENSLNDFNEKDKHKEEEKDLKQNNDVNISTEGNIDTRPRNSVHNILKIFENKFKGENQNLNKNNENKTAESAMVKEKEMDNNVDKKTYDIKAENNNFAKIQRTENINNIDKTKNNDILLNNDNEVKNKKEDNDDNESDIEREKLANYAKDDKMRNSALIKVGDSIGGRNSAIINRNVPVESGRTSSFVRPQVLRSSKNPNIKAKTAAVKGTNNANNDELTASSSENPYIKEAYISNHNEHLLNERKSVKDLIKMNEIRSELIKQRATFNPKNLDELKEFLKSLEKYDESDKEIVDEILKQNKEKLLDLGVSENQCGSVRNLIDFYENLLKKSEGERKTVINLPKSIIDEVRDEEDASLKGSRNFEMKRDDDESLSEESVISMDEELITLEDQLAKNPNLKTEESEEVVGTKPKEFTFRPNLEITSERVVEYDYNNNNVIYSDLRSKIFIFNF